MTEGIELRIERTAIGGDGIAREPSGRTVFVDGALPGELVRATIVEQQKQWARALVEEIVEPSAHRRTPPCVEIARGCGGCDLQHATPAGQLEVRVAMVADALRRQAKLADHPAIETRELPTDGYRTTVRLGVDEAGRAGFRRRGSAEHVPVASCLITHPALNDLITNHRYPGASEVTLRLGARTGERLALVDPSADGCTLPDDVRLVGADQLAAGKRAWYHEELAGRRWRISAESFFQNRPDGAEMLVEVASEMLATLTPGSHLVDLYAGVGLFAGTVGAAHRTTVVEVVQSSVADARVNLADLDAKIVRSDVAEWTPRRADAVIADPSRDGLGKQAARVVHDTGASHVVLVSCDPAAFGRDVGLLVARGFGLARVVVVDLFPQTSHVETVALLTR